MSQSRRSSLSSTQKFLDLSWRRLKRAIPREMAYPGRQLRQVIIVGAGARGRRLAGMLNDHPELGIRLLGFVDDLVDDLKAPGMIGPVNEIAQILDDFAVDEIVVALPLKSHYERVTEVIRAARDQGITVSLESELFDACFVRAATRHIENLPVLALHTVSRKGWEPAAKRVIDLVLAIVLIVFLSPLMLLISLLVKMTSAGTVIYAQERIGHCKKRFQMLKFRTMVADADLRQKDLESMNEVSGPVFKIKDDPRITPFGRWLRKTSLDELPQLFNVLRGEMSLVGPRPVAVRDFELYDEYWFNRRFSVKPGITCIWQVSGRSNTSFERWIRQDLEYIDNWSLLLDLELLLKTIPAVLRGTGAM